MKLRDASPRQLERWDHAIDESVNGTLFHRLDFLRYHGARFAGEERHLVLIDGEEPIAWMPLAVTESGGERLARSPYGGSYGGFAFRTQPTYSVGRQVVEALVAFLEEERIHRCTITPPIACCSDEPLDTFTFTLLEGGFSSVNRDISSVVPLWTPTTAHDRATSRARGAARKARAAGVQVSTHVGIDEFWPLMEAGYIDRGRTPTHDRDQLRWLAEALPTRVWFDVGHVAGRNVAGVAYFAINDRVNSSFYLCQDPEHADLQAQSLLVLDGLERSRSEGFRYFDLGTSTVTMEARPAIFRFKEAFASIGMFREAFEWRRR